MPRHNSQRHGDSGDGHRGIKLPKAIREELNLDESSLRHSKGRRGGGGGGRRGGGYGGGRPVDRKTQRKQLREEKKVRQRQHSARAPPSHATEDLDDDEFDESEDDAAPDPPPKKAERKSKTKEKTSKRKVRDSDSESDDDAAAKAKAAKKAAKRKEREEESEGRAPKKAKSLSKGVKDKLAQDEAEIAYLEKKLGIKSKKTPKSFEDDGLDFLLDGLDRDFLDDEDDVEEKPRGKEKKRKAEAKIVEESEEEDMDGESGYDDMSDGLDGLLDGSSDEEDEVLSEPEEDDEFNGFSDDDDEDDEENDLDDSKSAPEPVRTRPDPTKPFVASTAKYIPPSLRKPAATESESLVRLRRQIQGLINRFSEANLLSILSEIEEVYRNNPRGDVTNILTDIIISSICDRSSLLDTFMILHGGFVAGVYKLIGTDFGGHIVQRIVEEFEPYHEKANGRGVEDQVGKEATNLMSFLSELYNFQVVSSVLVFDYIRRFLSELTELHTELLLKIVRNSGPQLRSDDPTALKSLVQLLQTSVAAAGGESKLSTRTKFMIETLTNLKNNRLKTSNAAAAVTTEATTRMRKLLGTLNTRRLRATEPLRASLADIQNAGTKGKWWLVGASWAGPSNTTDTTTTSATDTTQLAEAVSTINVEDSDDDVLPGITDLTSLARSHRMNTAHRRAIFTTLLSSSDYLDCASRILKLHLPRAQHPTIAHVLLHCALAEPTYNPYYTLVATHLSLQNHAVRMAFQYSFWKYLEQLDSDDDDVEELSLQAVVNLGKLYAGMVGSGAATLGALLKTTERWKGRGKMVKILLEVLLGGVVKDENVWWEGQGLEGGLLKGVVWFIGKREEGVILAAGGGDEGRKKVRKVKKELEERMRKEVLMD